jgi:large subunit ribosomal protein L9
MMAKKKPAAKPKGVQVILNAPVKGVGKKGELVTVKQAYAENVIVRGGLGVIADQEALDRLAADNAAAAAAAAAAKAQAVADEETLAKVVGEKGLTIQKNVGPTGEVFGSVTAAEVAELIKEHVGITVEKKAINPPAIKSVGAGVAEVTLHKEVVAKVKIVIAPAS